MLSPPARGSHCGPGESLRKPLASWRMGSAWSRVLQPWLPDQMCLLQRCVDGWHGGAPLVGGTPLQCWSFFHALLLRPSVGCRPHPSGWAPRHSPLLGFSGLWLRLCVCHWPPSWWPQCPGVRRPGRGLPVVESLVTLELRRDLAGSGILPLWMCHLVGTCLSPPWLVLVEA